MTIRLSGDDVPLASLAIAALVLAIAAFAVVRITRQGSRNPPRVAGRRGAVAPEAGDETWSTEAVDPARHPVAFLVALGRAMIDSGASVTQVGASLRRVAAVNGVDDAAFVVLPTVSASWFGRA